MKSDEEIRMEGFEALREKLGLVDMERFITLINGNKFNYTKWREKLYEDMDIEDLADRADRFSRGLDNEQLSSLLFVDTPAAAQKTLLTLS